MPHNICIAGKNDIAVNSLLYLINELNINKNNIIALPNKTDNGIDTWQKSFLKCAIENDIKIYNLEDIYEINDLIFISLEFDRIIKTQKFKTKNLYNIHFSKLPKYKGMYTSVLPIINGESYSGVTLHKIDDGIDTGDIIAQKVFKISVNDTSRDLYFKYLKYSFKLFKENIENILTNSFTAKKQPFINSSYYSTKSINFKSINIDFNKTSYEIHNQIRAFCFKEYQYPQINNCYVENSIFNGEFIGYNKFVEEKDKFIISGIDGYKIIVLKLHSNNNFDFNYPPPLKRIFSCIDKPNMKIRRLYAA